MELGPQNHSGDGLLGLNSIIVVYMDPLGYALEGLVARGLFVTTQLSSVPILRKHCSMTGGFSYLLFELLDYVLDNRAAVVL